MKLTPEQLDALVGEVGFCIDGASFESALEQSQRGIDSAPDVAHLLTEEARLTKKLFRFATQAMHYGDFVRGSRGGPANRFLDHGNYLAYGLGASAWLGCPAWQDAPWRFGV